MEVMRDGVECFVLPDEAKCDLTDQHPFDMTECPCLYGYCDGDCYHYKEGEK